MKRADILTLLTALVFAVGSSLLGFAAAYYGWSLSLFAKFLVAYGALLMIVGILTWKEHGGGPKITLIAFILLLLMWGIAMALYAYYHYTYEWIDPHRLIE